MTHFTNAQIRLAEMHINDINCPICGEQKRPEYQYCNYDCYCEGKKSQEQKEKNNGIKDGRINYPIIIRGREFKHIPPNNKEAHEWNEKTKKWEKKNA